jgi:hypothetical protein
MRRGVQAYQGERLFSVVPHRMPFDAPIYAAWRPGIQERAPVVVLPNNCMYVILCPDGVAFRHTRASGCGGTAKR